MYRIWENLYSKLQNCKSRHHHQRVEEHSLVTHNPNLGSNFILKYLESEEDLQGSGRLGKEKASLHSGQCQPLWISGESVYQVTQEAAEGIRFAAIPRSTPTCPIDVGHLPWSGSQPCKKNVGKLTRNLSMSYYENES